MKNFLLFLVFLSLSIGIYWPGLNSPFIYDDKILIQQNEYLKEGKILKLLSQDFTSEKIKEGMYRPLTLLSFFLNYLINGENPLGYHLLNLILHSLTTLFLFLLLLKIFKHLGYKTAFLLSLFYLFLPANSQACLYVSARFTLLFSLFYLIAFLKYVERKRGVSLFFFSLALFSKEEALTFPLVLLIYEFFTSKEWKYFRFYFCSCLIPIAFFIFIRNLLLTHWMGYSLVLSFPKFILYLKSCAFFFKNFFSAFSLPVIEHDLNQMDLFFYYSGIFICGLLFLIALKRRDILGFVIVFPFISVFSFLVMIPLNFPGQGMEYRFYLANMFYPLLIAVILESIREKRLPAVVLRSLIFSFSLISLPWLYLRAFYWGDPYRLWKRTVEEYPDLCAPHINYSNVLFEKGMFEESLVQAQEAILIEKSNYLGYYNLGCALAMLGRYQEAKDAFEKAILYGDFYAPAHYNLALTYLILGDKMKAMQEFEKGYKIRKIKSLK